MLLLHQQGHRHHADRDEPAPARAFLLRQVHIGHSYLLGVPPRLRRPVRCLVHVLHSDAEEALVVGIVGQGTAVYDGGRCFRGGGVHHHEMGRVRRVSSLSDRDVGLAMRFLVRLPMGDQKDSS